MSDQPHVVCVIPARYGAQRFPGKPLAKIHGWPMIEWVVRAAQAVPEIDELLVATDDERIAEAVRAIGAEAVMTPPDCPSGTDRIAAALKNRKAELVINIQGDEPGMKPEPIQAALKAIIDDPRCDVSTVCTPIRDPKVFEDPGCVKVVRGQGGQALYFSRSPIPSQVRARQKESGEIIGYKHLGLYIYRREALEAYVMLEQGELELEEKLEQLRFLEIGATIRCPSTDYDSIGVDTEEDISKAEKLLSKPAES